MINWHVVDAISMKYPTRPPRELAAELWLFLSQWLGTDLYEKRDLLAHGMSENGFELRRRLSIDSEGGTR